MSDSDSDSESDYSFDESFPLIIWNKLLLT